MPITRSAATAAAQGAIVTRPGWLLELGDGQNRFCSRGDIPLLMGVPWAGADMEIRGLGADGSLATGGTVTWIDADDAIVTLLMTDQIAGAAATLWLFDGAATADADPMFAFEGVIDGVDYDPEARSVSGQLALPTRQPWPHYGPAIGMHHALPAGTVQRVGADTYVVERRR